ncbi:MAG: hypothetical protein KC496_19615 [Anaerolineae bacterium]|nr:hypothetical protein [Anaerolineae bacterium]
MNDYFALKQHEHRVNHSVRVSQERRLAQEIKGETKSPLLRTNMLSMGIILSSVLVMVIYFSVV